METREVDPDQKNQHRESARSLLDPNAPQYARIKAALKSEKQRMELARLNDDLERLKRQPGWSFYYGLPDESGRGFENGEQYKLQLIEEYREKIQRLEQGDFSDFPRYTSRKESDSDSDDPKRYYMGNQD